MKITQLLLLSVAAFGTVVPSHAQSSSKLAGSSTAAIQTDAATPVPAPTIITTAPYTISSPGYYQLGADLTVTNTTGNIITINAGNVILDFGGHYISGPNNATATSTLFGVVATERGNITIMNGTIAYCYEGIAFFGNNSSTSVNVNQTVQNMLVTYVAHVGINFQNALYSKAVDNTVSNIGGATATNGTGNYGFFAQGTGNNISRNTIIKVTGPSNSTASAYGVFVPESSSALAVGNQIFNTYYGLFFDGTLGKYQDNLTLNVTSPFNGGVAVGTNN